MFRNRRPTPSPQTIEHLRQLAYITGGALCGVTALYLEECRRRIQIVQRVLDKRRAIIQAAQSRRYYQVAVAARFGEADGEDIHVLGPRLQSWYDNTEMNDVSSRPARRREAAPALKDSSAIQNSGSVESRDDESTSGRLDQVYKLNLIRKTKSPPLPSRKASKGYGDDPRVLYDQQPSSQNRSQDFQRPEDYSDLKRTRKETSLARARQSALAGNLVRLYDPDVSLNKDGIREEETRQPKTEAEQQISNLIRYHKGFGGHTRKAENVPRIGEASEDPEPLPNELLDTGTKERGSSDSKSMYAPLSDAGTLRNDDLLSQIKSSTTPIADGVHEVEEASVPISDGRLKDGAVHVTSQENAIPSAPFGFPTALEDRSLSPQADNPSKASEPAEDLELSKSMTTSAPFGIAGGMSNDNLVFPAKTHSTITEDNLASLDPPFVNANNYVDDRIRLAMDGLDADSARSLVELLEGFEDSDTTAPRPAAKRRKPSPSQMTGEGQLHGQLAGTHYSSREINEFDSVDGPYTIRKRWLQARIGTLVSANMAHHRHDSIQETETLWPYAISEGSFGDVQRLYRWMVDNGSFTTAHGRSVVESSSRLNETSGGSIGFTWYAEVLNAEDYGKGEVEEVLKQKVRLLSHAMTWNISVAAQRLGSLLLTRKTRMALEEPTIVRVVESECAHLLSTAGASRATTLLAIAYEWLKPKPKHESSIIKRLLPLSTEILETALEEGDSKSCIRILRRNQKMLSIEDFRNQFNRFLEECGKQKSYSTLAEVIADGPDDWSPQNLVEAANDSNKAILAVAFCSSARLRTAFEDAYHQVPNAFRDFVNEHATTDALRAIWKSTRNMDTVEAEAQRLSTRLKDCNDEMALTRLDDGLLELYLTSGKHESALECLTRIHQKRNSDVQFVALAALYFAGRWDWDGLAHLLETSKAHAPFEFDYSSTKSLNNVIRFYSQTHSPLETWTFISSAIDELGFTPNAATAQLMLHKLIRSKSINLIPRWLRFLSAIGADFGLTGSATADLVRQYYLWNRQPSDFLFRLSHNLTASVPHFNVDHFRPVLKMAIGHDLRFGTRGGDASVVQQQALARLEELEHAPDIEPEFHAFDQNGDQVHDSSESRLEDAEEEYHRTVSLFNDEPQPADVPNEGFAVAEAEEVGRSEEVSDPSKHDHGPYVLDEGIDISDEEGRQDADHYTLRPSHTNCGQHERIVGPRRKREIEGDMALNLSMHRYREILDQYNSSCDSTGLPMSVRALKHATDASIRLHEGDTTHAEKRIADAETSGMDVSRAMDTLLIHRSSVLTIHDTREARRVCNATIEYYGRHFKGGHQLRYGLAHNVANVLVSKGHAEQALRLLSTIFQSDYIARRIASIKTMSVWVKAYAKLLSMDGVKWVVRRVLLENFPIDRIFLHDLEMVSTFPFLDADQKRIRGWLKLCQHKRMEQDLEAKVFGHQLVDCLIEYAHKYPLRARLTKSKRQRAMEDHAKFQLRDLRGEKARHLENDDAVDRADANVQSQEAFATYQPYHADDIGFPVYDAVDEPTLPSEPVKPHETGNTGDTPFPHYV